MAIHDVAVSSALASVNPLNPHSSLGALGMFLVLFAEARLLAGFFLPGDLRLFSAGLHRTTAAGSSVHLSLTTVLPEAAGGAPLGARTGYLIGAQAGPAVLDRPDRPRLQQAVARADRVLHRYGPGPGHAIVLVRFIPLVRTVLNPLAVTVGIAPRTFTLSQVRRGVVWAAGVIMAGYLLAQGIPNVDEYLLPIIAGIILLSVIPVTLEVRRSRECDSEPGREDS